MRSPLIPLSKSLYVIGLGTSNVNQGQRNERKKAIRVFINKEVCEGKRENDLESESRRTGFPAALDSAAKVQT